MGAGIWRTGGAGGFDPKRDAERMGSVLIGGAWGEVVGAGASTNEPATESARSVTVGDEVRARKICEARCVLGMRQMGGEAVLGGRG